MIQMMYAVQNEAGQYLNMRLERCVGEYQFTWGNLTDATYFNTKEGALGYVLEEESEHQSMFVVTVQSEVKAKEKASDLAQQMESQNQKIIAEAIMKKEPISRNTLKEVVHIIMEGSGKIIGTRKVQEKEMTILFEEVQEDGWVLKKEGLML